VVGKRVVALGALVCGVVAVEEALAACDVALEADVAVEIKGRA